MMDYMMPPNKSPEPSAVGAVSCTVVVYVTSRLWLGFLLWAPLS